MNEGHAFAKSHSDLKIAKAATANNPSIPATSIYWGGRRGLNPRPPESQSGALPTELRPPLIFITCPEDQGHGTPGRTRTFNPRLRRPMLYPVELRALKSTRRVQTQGKFGRGREIRTPDILLPKQARYQTALYPECLSVVTRFKQDKTLIKSRGAHST